jgi:hypothetical protein
LLCFGLFVYILYSKLRKFTNTKGWQKKAEEKTGIPVLKKQAGRLERMLSRYIDKNSVYNVGDYRVPSIDNSNMSNMINTPNDYALFSNNS